MAKQDKQDVSTEIQIIEVQRGKITFCVLGETPLLHNCMSEKARHELLLPKGRKTNAEKQSTLKHNPVEEYRASIYRSRDTNSPTLIQHLASAFRKSMANAALDLPDVTKAEIGRLVWVEGDRVDIYGKPMIDLRIVRQAGQNRTPDVRTRCITPEWACKVTVSFTKPRITEQGVANLLAAAGFCIGVGDYRNEKGAGNYGLFRLCSADDPDFVRIMANDGRAVQEAGMETPEPYNDETEELLSWYQDAVKTHRSFAPIVSDKNSEAGSRRSKGRNGKAAADQAADAAADGANS